MLYSLVVPCTRVGANPVDYIADVLDRIDKTPGNLLPHRWKPLENGREATHFGA